MAEPVIFIKKEVDDDLVILTRQDWPDYVEGEDIYVRVTLDQLECFQLAMKHCDRPSHKTAMTRERGFPVRSIEMYEDLQHLERLIEIAKRRRRERTDDGDGEVGWSW